MLLLRKIAVKIHPDVESQLIRFLSKPQLNPIKLFYFLLLLIAKIVCFQIFLLSNDLAYQRVTIKLNEAAFLGSPNFIQDTNLGCSTNVIKSIIFRYPKVVPLRGLRSCLKTPVLTSKKGFKGSSSVFLVK